MRNAVRARQTIWAGWTVLEDSCRTCGGPLPRRAGTRGRASVYCSAACRQKAYRSRRAPAGGEVVHELIADIERRVQSLAPQPPRRSTRT